MVAPSATTENPSLSLLREEMMNPDSIILTQRDTDPPAEPQVEGLVIQAADKSPRSTCWERDLSV